jgi:hypothetical protein
MPSDLQEIIFRIGDDQKGSLVPTINTSKANQSLGMVFLFNSDQIDQAISRMPNLSKSYFDFLKQKSLS